MAQQQISGDTIRKMRRAKVLLGLKRKPKEKANIDYDDFDDDGWTRFMISKRLVT